MSAQSGGSQTADLGALHRNFSGIVNNSPYQNNGQGYWTVYLLVMLVVAEQ